MKRWITTTLIGVLATLLALSACTPTTPRTSPTPRIDYAALETAIENRISSGSVSLDNIRAVLVSVDGQAKIAHYRHGFTPDDHAHVWSVTKSVLSSLIGIAIGDGLVGGLDQPLSTLLPDHRKAMDAQVAAVTLRQLLTMSGGIPVELPPSAERNIKAGASAVDALLRNGLQNPPGMIFSYSNFSADLAAAVLDAGC